MRTRIEIEEEIGALSKERQQIDSGVQAHVNCGGGHLIMQGHVNRSEELRQQIEGLKRERQQLDAG